MSFAKFPHQMRVRMHRRNSRCKNLKGEAGSGSKIKEFTHLLQTYTHATGGEERARGGESSEHNCRLIKGPLIYSTKGPFVSLLRVHFCWQSERQKGDL